MCGAGLWYRFGPGIHRNPPGRNLRGTSFDLVTLRKQYAYFLGLCADLTGFVLAAAALRLLPLFLVQSVIAFSVGVTAVISALLGIRLAALGWIALAVGAGGLVLLWLSAEPTPSHTLPAGWMLPAAAVPVAALGYLGRKMPPRVATPMLAFAAGLGFSVVRPGFAAGAVVGLALAVTGAAGAAYYASAGDPSGASVAAGKFPGEHRTGAKVTQIPTPARD